MVFFSALAGFHFSFSKTNHDLPSKLNLGLATMPGYERRNWTVMVSFSRDKILKAYHGLLLIGEFSGTMVTLYKFFPSWTTSFKRAPENSLEKETPAPSKFQVCLGCNGTFGLKSARDMEGKQKRSNKPILMAGITFTIWVSTCL